MDNRLGGIGKSTGGIQLRLYPYGKPAIKQCRQGSKKKKKRNMK
jgi:hypothetical protein